MKPLPYDWIEVFAGTFAFVCICGAVYFGACALSLLMGWQL